MDEQTISINDSNFAREQDIITRTEDTKFAYEKRYYFDNYIYSAKFAKKRSITETIDFLELQCFELVGSTIFEILAGSSDNIKFLEEHFAEPLTPALEEEWNNILNSSTDTIITPSSLTLVFDVPDPTPTEEVF